MTDSEPEHDVDENYCVAFAAETAAILVIGCVSGLRGLKKIRKGVGYVHTFMCRQYSRPHISSVVKLLSSQYVV